MHWFVKLLNQELLKSSSKNVAVESFESGRSSIDIAAVEALANQTSVQPPSNFRLGLLDLATVFRQTYNAATAFRRVQCYFFPVVAFTFDRYVVAVHRQTIECIAAAFARVRSRTVPKGEPPVGMPNSREAVPIIRHPYFLTQCCVLRNAFRA